MGFTASFWILLAKKSFVSSSTRRWWNVFFAKNRFFSEPFLLHFLPLIRKIWRKTNLEKITPHFEMSHFLAQIRLTSKKILHISHFLPCSVSNIFLCFGKNRHFVPLIRQPSIHWSCNLFIFWPNINKTKLVPYAKFCSRTIVVIVFIWMVYFRIDTCTRRVFECARLRWWHTVAHDAVRI